MSADFKESIIILMQHPMMRKPLSSLSNEECEKAYNFLRELINWSVDEEYTLLDNIQMARLKYTQGELTYILNPDNKDTIIRHYRSALHDLYRGGIDLSIGKWAELISLRSIEQVKLSSINHTTVHEGRV